MSEAKPICCAMRKKVCFAPIVIPEGFCDVPDAEMIDFLRFVSGEAPLLVFRFCPWCGESMKGQQVRIVGPDSTEGTS